MEAEKMNRYIIGKYTFSRLSESKLTSIFYLEVKELRVYLRTN